MPGPQLPGLVSGVVLAVGCWLLVQSLRADYGALTGFDAPWNDRLVGLAACALGLFRALRRMTLRTATVCGAAIGCWSLSAPLMIDYGFGADSTLATGADVLAGVLIAGLSLLGHLHATDPMVED
ncbi:hypothetical protein [Actinokineospora sp. NBRC 105648]|uniref:SPW repeat domain-containing protein n=1 Tax=Actinokineospora sp. NBRC 105648 TaxID=3032206 RepID=UPI002553A9ED|nr:hypothetical protein [Actinokineospora sp. NBRC 105648]